MLLEVLEYGFIQRALITGISVATICSIVGLFLVLKRYSLFGDAMSHVAFGGLSIGLFLNIYPLWTAFIVSVFAALGITKLRESAKIPPDASVAVLLSSGLAVGIVLITLSGGFSLDLFSFLFGSILLVSVSDTITVVLMSIAIIVFMVRIYRKLMYITFDERQASVSGINVKLVNYLFIAIAGITIVTSIRLVGVLLISALIVIPNITALSIGRGFKKTTVISIGIANFSVIVGIIVSYIANISPGASIVLTAIIVFFATLLTKYIVRKLSLRTESMKKSSS
jgi:zinc transport system permease protein